MSRYSADTGALGLTGLPSEAPGKGGSVMMFTKPDIA